MTLEKQIEAVRRHLTAAEEREATRLEFWLESGYVSDLAALEERQEYTERVSKQLQRLERALQVRYWQKNTELLVYGEAQQDRVCQHEGFSHTRNVECPDPPDVSMKLAALAGWVPNRPSGSGDR